MRPSHHQAKKWPKTNSPIRSIDAFVPFKVVTRLIFWDERSLYFEQSFVSLHDGFVRAVAICKNTVVGGSMVEMMASVGVKSAPAMPKEVRNRRVKF